MRKCFFKRISNKKGFTLVELIVAIAIMAILSSIILPSMSAASTRQLAEKYKQSCLTVLDTAEIITDTINHGAQIVSGFKVLKDNGTLDKTQINACLKLENVNAADYEIRVFEVTDSNNGSNGQLPSTYTFSKDLVCVYICSSSHKDKFYPAGAIYFKSGSDTMTAMIKYDYVIGSTIAMSTDFGNPYR